MDLGNSIIENKMILSNWILLSLLPSKNPITYLPCFRMSWLNIFNTRTRYYIYRQRRVEYTFAKPTADVQECTLLLQLQTFGNWVYVLYTIDKYLVEQPNSFHS